MSSILEPRVSEAFSGALEREYGCLLAPSVRWFDDENSAVTILRGDVPTEAGVYFRYSVDRLLIHYGDRAALIDGARRAADTAIDKAWDVLWEGATSEYMVRA